jgi:hypothetical protein
VVAPIVLVVDIVLVDGDAPRRCAADNCTGDEGGPFEVGNQVLISSHRKLLRRHF